MGVGPVVQMFRMEEGWSKVFYRKNHQSLEQPLQECGGVPITGRFQGAIGQGAR